MPHFDKAHVADALDNAIKSTNIFNDGTIAVAKVRDVISAYALANAELAKLDRAAKTKASASPSKKRTRR